MSLGSRPDCLPGPEGRGLKLLFPGADQSALNSFDEFFDKELYDASGPEPIKTETDGVDDLFSMNASLANEPNAIPAHAGQSAHLEPWRKGLWCLNQQPSSQYLVVDKTRKTDNIPLLDISPSRLVTNDDFALTNPRSASQSPGTKSHLPARLQKPHCSNPTTQQSTACGMALSPSPMYSRYFDDGRNEYIDAWQHGFQNFNLHLSDNYPDVFAMPTNTQLSPLDFSLGHSRKAVVTNGQLKVDSLRSATMHRFDRSLDQLHSVENPSSHDLASSLSSNMDATTRNMFPEPSDRDDMAYNFINEVVPLMSDWTSQSPSSPNNSQRSHLSHTSGEQQQSSAYATLLPSTWWSPHTARPRRGTQASRESYPELYQPKPRRGAHQVLGQDHREGVGIQHPSAEKIGVAIPYHPAEVPTSFMPRPPSKYSSNMEATQNHALDSYPALPRPILNFPQGPPFTMPRTRARAASSRSASESLSPTHRPSRVNQQRSPSRREPSQHRRKSIQKQGPVKDSCTETPRHQSTSRPPRTPKTPKIPGDGLQIDFVNFTPKDAVKLLSDVAPSGSSKTRARREQEARERRKKLSEAALAAVRQAGGDVEALERAILS